MMDALEHLTDTDLTALAAAIRSGRLTAPFTPVSVQRYCGLPQAAIAAARLQQLHEEGMRPPHLALLAEVIVRTRRRKPQDADVVDLVWTGPETPGTVNRDTGVVVRELFGAAEEEVLVAGFAVYRGQEIFKRLAERMGERPGLHVRFFLDVHRAPGDSSLAEDVLHRFAHRFQTHEWPGGRLPELYYDPRSLDQEVAKRSSLHAKCIIVDRRSAFVTSANFTEAAQTRNIEVGALIRCEWFAVRLTEHFDTLVDSGVLKLLHPPRPAQQ
ncbi:MAG TPA: DISARM system phospholipase D-like protein DrmC [Gemmataceae bacterium]|nr:DISARM system phospholipase D-like protein DrmC [Gemmataceae bacterium]